LQQEDNQHEQGVGHEKRKHRLVSQLNQVGGNAGLRFISDRGAKERNKPKVVLVRPASWQLPPGWTRRR